MLGPTTALVQGSVELIIILTTQDITTFGIKEVENYTNTNSIKNEWLRFNLRIQNETKTAKKPS